MTEDWAWILAAGKQNSILIFTNSCLYSTRKIDISYDCFYPSRLINPNSSLAFKIEKN